MAKLIAISGAQGCGKSTTMNVLRDVFELNIDVFSAPRHTQKEMGYESLAEVLALPSDKIKEFQIEILKTKLKRDIANEIQTSKFVIVERCFADIYAFAFQWAIQSVDPKFILWVEEEYKPLCVKYQKQIDYFTFQLAPLKSFEVDPRRADEDSRFLIHERISGFLFDTKQEGKVNFALLGALCSSLDARTNVINEILDFYYENNKNHKVIVN